MSEPTVTATKKPVVGRSPAYPFISLKKALEQADALRKAEGKYAVPLPSAFKAWGYGIKSSGGRQTLAALKYFGLIDILGEGNSRQVKISERALRVLLDDREDQTEKNALIVQLALQPKVNRNLRFKFGDGLPSDATVRHYLIFEMGFNESAANEVLSQFKATSEFAGLYKPSAAIDIQDADAGDEADDPGADEPPVPAPPPPPVRQNPGATTQPPPPPPPKVQKETQLMSGERVVFTEEGQPQQYLKLIASGEVDDFLLEALEDFVKRQRKRLAASKQEEGKAN